MRKVAHCLALSGYHSRIAILYLRLLVLQDKYSQKVYVRIHTSFVLLRSESPSGKCAKLHTVAASNNRHHLTRTVATKSSTVGFTFVRGAWHCKNWKNSTDFSVSYFNLKVLRALFGEA